MVTTVNGDINVSANVTSTDGIFTGDGSGLYNIDFSGFNLPDPNITVTLTGDSTGSGNTTLTDLANGTITINTSVPDTIYGKNAISTGLLIGGEITINATNTLFDISAGSGYIVDGSTNPSTTEPVKISWAAMNGNSLPNIAIQPVTYISIDEFGAIHQQASFPDAEERRTRIFLGLAVH